MSQTPVNYIYAVCLGEPAGNFSRCLNPLAGITLCLIASNFLANYGRLQSWSLAGGRLYGVSPRPFRPKFTFDAVLS